MLSKIKSLLRVSLLVAIAEMVGGCARPHLYPVCFYEAAPPQQRLQDYYAPRLIALVQNTAGDSPRTKPTVSPDGRWLIAKVTGRQDHRLSVVWPRLACLGNALNSPGTKQEADCVTYVEFFVRTHNYFSFGNARDAGGFDIWNESAVRNTLVHCHQIKEDEVPQQ